MGNQLEEKGHSICELMAYHLKMEGEKLRPGTMKNYLTTEDYVKRFTKAKFGKEDIFLKQLNQEFIIEFEHFIRNNPLKQHDPCAVNGLMKHMERIKKVARWSRQLGWLELYSFADYKLSFKRYKRKKPDLTELTKIEKQFLSNQSIAYVKDLFLFSCYTGLAYADVMALRPENLEKDSEGKLWRKLYRQKSDEFSRPAFKHCY